MSDNIGFKKDGIQFFYQHVNIVDADVVGPKILVRIARGTGGIRK
jgi:hypothetical protein